MIQTSDTEVMGTDKISQQVDYRYFFNLTCTLMFSTSSFESSKVDKVHSGACSLGKRNQNTSWSSF